MSADIATIRQALRDMQAEPEGPARNARAERLLTEAEQTGDTALVIEALVHQLQVYNYSSEKDKMFVPFARLLKLWDEQPGDFDRFMTHHLFWMFKWVSSSMIDQPHIPLAAIEKWQAEMAHRYRLAGHSERAVRHGELTIARHLGDLERGERAHRAWLAADRDRMANCHACELHGQGSWQVLRGQDEEGLKTWAPVLEGEHVCAHEPHAVLASSLLPLLRTGRADQARAHHLRGYRMVRPMESMRYSAALHIEFCALTGNEARALEILAERPAYFTDSGNPGSLMSFLAVTALLMDRLVALGHGGQSVPGPAGTEWTAASLAVEARTRALALAARFDERNGNGYVTQELRTRLAQVPLLDRLPLGVRAARPMSAAPAAPVPPASGAGDADAPDLAALLAEAHRLSEALRPEAGDAWRAVAARTEREGAVLAPLDRATLEDHLAMDGTLPPAEAARAFRTAAGLYEAGGDAGEAVAASARETFARALGGETDEAAVLIAPLVERALALHAGGGATARQASGVLVCRARIVEQRMLRATDEESHDAAVADLERAAREVLAFTEPRRDEGRLATRIAEALGCLGDVAAHRGDAPAALGLYERAAAEAHDAGLPWSAVDYEVRVARTAAGLEDHATAERAARSALEHGDAFVSPSGRARLRLQLADLLAATGQIAEAADLALDASHWADEAGESGTLGVYARHQLGGRLLWLGRAAEAAAVLEAVLPDVSAEDHGDGMLVQTLWWLGEGLMALDEPRAAAEHWLRAADIARTWPEQHDHAMLAQLAGQALYRAELNPEAEQAYARAGELWRALDEAQSLVRTLRVRAWIALREGPSGMGAARAFMAEAARECAARPELRAELAATYRQTAELLAQSCEGEPGEAADDPVRVVYEEALGYAERAAETFQEAGPEQLAARTGALLMAAWLEADLGRGRAALGRAAQVVAAYEGVPEGADETVDARRAEVESVRAYVAKAA